MAFNPNEHLMPLKGKQYLQVMWRIAWLRDSHPDWMVQTNMVTHDAEKNHAIFKATIADNNGTIISTGYGSESARDFGDYIEKAETKAIGRALALAGFGTQFTGDELDEGQRIVDSPADVPAPKKPRAKKQAEPIPTQAEPQAETQICERCSAPLELVKRNGEPWLEQAHYSKSRFGAILCRKCMKDALSESVSK